MHIAGHFGTNSGSSCLSTVIVQFFVMQSVKELGLQMTPVKETLVDMAVTLLQLGIATPRQKQSKQ